MVDQKQLISHYRESGSIKETSRWAGVSEQTVRRILLTAGEYSNSRSREISKMIADGMTPYQIAEALGIGPKTVNGYMDYQRGAYIMGDKTANALRIAAMRERRRKHET